MDKYILVVPSSPNEGRDDDYNEWYDTIHLEDLLAIPGVVSGRRFQALLQSPNPQPSPYLAIYELELDDPATALGQIAARAESGEIRMTDAIDLTTTEVWLYKAR